MLKVVPECGSRTGAKTRAWFEIRPLGCRESAGSNLARSDEPLLSLPTQGRSASRHVDQIHLSLFTAVCVPVQRSGTVLVISPCRTERNDYEYFICGRSVEVVGTVAVAVSAADALNSDAPLGPVE